MSAQHVFSLLRPLIGVACALTLVGCAGSARFPALDQGASDSTVVPDLTDFGWQFGDVPIGDGPAPGDGPLLAKDIGPTPDKTPPPCAGGCGDGDACTLDICVAGKCKNTPRDCGDGDGCTTDSCKAGKCIHTPIGCDDGDPCTTDSCKNNTCAYTKGGQIIYRSTNGGSNAHAYTTHQTAPPGFAIEGPVFRTLKAGGAGLAKVYQQISGSGDYMLSLSATEGVACCGYTNGGDIGYGITSKQGSAVPVYRLNHPAGLHLSSLSSSEGVQFGYKLEGITFHACPL